MTRLAPALGIATALAVAGGCAYTASTLLPAHIKTVRIPVARNGTERFGLEQMLTDALFAAYTRDNSVRVVNGPADAELGVGITRYRNDVFSYTATEQADEYQITLVVSAVFTDIVKNKELWKGEAVTATQRYRLTVQGTTDPAAQAAADSSVVRKIADDIVARTIQGW
jgi:outer membrane lipopolysaccharide assembly protein LptE/RlpB